MLEIEKQRNRTEKGAYPESIISKEKVAELQELFDEAIPRVLGKVKNENITHILLTEKTARLFKVGFQRILKEVGLEDVKVGNFAPQYTHGFYSGDDEIKKDQIEKKLAFLPENKDGRYKIMILDEYKNSGITLENMEHGLIMRGFDEDSIVTEYIQKKDTVNNIMKSIIFKKSRKIFQEDTTTEYHARLRDGKKYVYRDTIGQISDMMLESIKNLKLN